VNTDGNLTLGGGSGTHAAGLFVASGNINVSTGTVVGALWSRTGLINASGVDVRAFPFWTHGFVHTSSGDVAVTANRSWRVGFGRAVLP
jgi:hypothetical protein